MQQTETKLGLCKRCKANRDTLLDMLQTEGENHDTAVIVIENCTDCMSLFREVKEQIRADEELKDKMAGTTK